MWENYKVSLREIKDYQHKWRDIPSLGTVRLNIVETLIPPENVISGDGQDLDIS